MAQLTGHESISAVVSQLQKADLYTDDNIQEMLFAGADILESNVQSAFIASGHNRHGDTLSHITRAKKVRKGRDGVPYVFVTVHGRDARGERYGAKAFVLNYGRKHGGAIPASHYWNSAVQASWNAVNGEMAKIAEEKLKEV